MEVNFQMYHYWRSQCAMKGVRMTSRERILAACNHKEADRVPIDCGSMRSTGVSAITFNNLMKYFGRRDPCLMYDYQQQLAYTGDFLRELFHVDSMDVGEAFVGDIQKDWKPWRLGDGSECLIPQYIDVRRDEEGTAYLYDAAGHRVGRMPLDAKTAAQCYYPYQQLEEIPEHIDPEVINQTFWSVPCLPFHLDLAGSQEDYETFVKTIKELRRKTDKALMISIGHSYFEFGGYIRELNNWLADIMMDPEGTNRLLDMMEETYMVKLDCIMKDIADDVDIVEFGDDLGTQSGAWMNPEIVKKMFIPRYKKLFDYVHQHSNAKVFLHSCGDLSTVLGMLADIGLDIINPVQTTAAHMDPVWLKKEFGKDLTFWGGGCEAQTILTFGTPQQVADQVKERIEIFGKDGGFVFNMVHNILENVPIENVLTMFKTAYEFGAY